MSNVYDNMSNAELEVCNFFKELKIFWTYEQPVFLSDYGNRPRIFVPDFYLPELGVYVEVIGNPKLNDYNRRWEIYMKNNIPIILTLPFNDKNWKSKLFDEIVNIHQLRYEKIKRIQGHWF